MPGSSIRLGSPEQHTATTQGNRGYDAHRPPYAAPPERPDCDRPACPKRQRRVFFFFQAEDGIRDADVTGVQTVCSSDLASFVPENHDDGTGISLILRLEAARVSATTSRRMSEMPVPSSWFSGTNEAVGAAKVKKIGRASCRGRG